VSSLLRFATSLFVKVFVSSMKILFSCFRYDKQVAAGARTGTPPVWSEFHQPKRCCNLPEHVPITVDITAGHRSRSVSHRSCNTSHSRSFSRPPQGLDRTGEEEGEGEQESRDLSRTRSRPEETMMTAMVTVVMVISLNLMFRF